MKLSSICHLLLVSMLLCSFSNLSNAQQANPLEGRWDLEVLKDGKTLPSWLEIRKSGISTLIGRFVYAMGSARPISEIEVDGDNFRFSIPPQWEGGSSDMIFIGSIKEDQLTGTMIYTDGQASSWNGSRAPHLEYVSSPQWGTPINIFNGRDLSGWHATGENQWLVQEGILKSPKPGANLVSDQKFMNFKLHAEFRYPEGSNSGIYLRGRYEVQIADNFGLLPSDILFGGVYGFIEPNTMAARKAGEWQTYDITLIGNRVTVVANGHKIITDQTIPGITGGALDSDEASSGSFFIQGDHGPVEFRKFVVTPMIE